MAIRELMRIDDGALVVTVVTDDTTGDVQSISAVNSGARTYTLTASDPRDRRTFSTSIAGGQSRSLSGAQLRNKHLRCFIGREADSQPLESLLAAVTVEVFD